MNVLSLFDGMSCGQIALDKLGIPINKYFAAEIDKYAIQVAKKNYPDMVHLGDVKELWVTTDLDTKDKGILDDGEIHKLDLLKGGSPCQGFSFAGKQLDFDDPRSQLFFEYVRLLKALKPKYFLLENVKMKQSSMDIISDALDVEPVFINSDKVSAQNRQRYWTNISFAGRYYEPINKDIKLQDVIESGYVDRDKSFCLDANYWKGGNLKTYFEKHRRQLVFSKDGLCHVGDADIKGIDSLRRTYHREGKAPTLTTMGGGHREPKVYVEPMSWRKLTPLECERLQTLPDGYTEGVSSTQRYKVCGNGFTVDIIAHILKGLLHENK